MCANRSEKAPFTRLSILPGGAHLTPASIIPVADDELIYTGRSVLNIGRRPRCRRSNNCSNADPRCGIIGCSIAAMTSSRTSVGPGRKNVPKDFVVLIQVQVFGVGQNSRLRNQRVQLLDRVS